MITLQQAKANSNKLRAEADEFLKKHRIIELLSKYGKLVPEGSYSYNLMVYRDFDTLLVNTGADSDTALKLAGELFEKFGNVRIHDGTKEQEPGKPLGYYLSIKAQDGKEEWKIDVWLISHLQHTAKGTPGLDVGWFDHKTQEEKDAMLLLKACLWEEGVYINKGIGSFHVYRAVNEGIRSVPDFYDWMKANYNYDRTKW